MDPALLIPLLAMLDDDDLDGGYWFEPFPDYDYEILECLLVWIVIAVILFNIYMISTMTGMNQVYCG